MDQISTLTPVSQFAENKSRDPTLYSSHVLFLMNWSGIWFMHQLVAFSLEEKIGHLRPEKGGDLGGHNNTFPRMNRDKIHDMDTHLLILWGNCMHMYNI
jgi:hypothetical protein